MIFAQESMSSFNLSCDLNFNLENIVKKYVRFISCLCLSNSELILKYYFLVTSPEIYNLRINLLKIYDSKYVFSFKFCVGMLLPLNKYVNKST